MNSSLLYEEKFYLLLKWLENEPVKINSVFCGHLLDISVFVSLYPWFWMQLKQKYLSLALLITGLWDPHCCCWRPGQIVTVGSYCCLEGADSPHPSLVQSGLRRWSPFALLPGNILACLCIRIYVSFLKKILSAVWVKRKSFSCGCCRIYSYNLYLLYCGSDLKLSFSYDYRFSDARSELLNGTIKVLNT